MIDKQYQRMVTHFLKRPFCDAHGYGHRWNIWYVKKDFEISMCPDCACYRSIIDDEQYNQDLDVQKVLDRHKRTKPIEIGRE